jgi:hypothetical protein
VETPSKPARLADLDLYLEALYDDEVSGKAAGAAAIAQLFREPEHLQARRRTPGMQGGRHTLHAAALQL